MDKACRQSRSTNSVDTLQAGCLRQPNLISRFLLPNNVHFICHLNLMKAAEENGLLSMSDWPNVGCRSFAAGLTVFRLQVPSKTAVFSPPFQQRSLLCVDSTLLSSSKSSNCSDRLLHAKLLCSISTVYPTHLRFFLQTAAGRDFCYPERFLDAHRSSF